MISPGDETNPDVLFPGFWLVLSTNGDAPDPALTAIEPCRMCAFRDAAIRGEPFIFQAGLRAGPAQIATISRIDGLPAGSAYPSHAPMVIT